MELGSTTNGNNDIRITHHSSSKSELGINKRPIKPRSPKISNSYFLAMRQIHESLVKPRYEGIQINVDKRGMHLGQSEIRSKSIASLVKKFLPERKLKCNLVTCVNQKQESRYSNSSSFFYDSNINYEGEQEIRSYAEMITAYNNTMMTIDNNASNMIRDQLKSRRMTVRLSKTFSGTTSTLSSSAYNLKNFTIQENTEETSMTDLSVDRSLDHSILIDDDFYDKLKKKEDLELRKSKITKPETTIRSYANMIADYSTTNNGTMKNFPSKKSEKHFSKLSMISSSPENVLTPVTSDFVLSPNFNTNTRKELNINEEIDWLRKVDKVIRNFKNATKGKEKKINDNEQLSLEERNVLQCVVIDESVKIDKIKSTQMTPRKIDFPGDKKNEEGLIKNLKGKTSYKTNKIDGIKMIGQCLSSDYNISTSSNVNSTIRKNLTQMTSKNMETNISNDPQVELRMMPSGKESVVSVNVESIGRTTEPRNLNSKELSVVVVSNNNQTSSNALPTNLRSENQSKFGTMCISISEDSLPVKELELFVNGKPISDVRSIKARTETLNVLTSMDKVEIRVPYSQDNPNTLNQSPKSFVKNLSNPESVLKLRIATAFDETNPILTSGDTNKVKRGSTDIESKNSKTKTRTEENNMNVIMSEVSSTRKTESNINEISGKKIEKSDEVSVKNSFQQIKEKQEQPVSSIKSENDYLKEPMSDIDLRFTKNFAAKPKSNLNIKQDDFLQAENVPSSNEKSVENESSKRANLKSIVSDMNTVKNGNIINKEDINKTLTSEKDNVRSLADIMIKHSGKSSDGNSSAISGKPKLASNQIDDQKSPKSGKHDSKTIDTIIKKSILSNQSLKTDTLDERVSLKQSPRLSDVKSKKEEDYQRKNDSTPTYVTDKKKITTRYNLTLTSNDKIQSDLKEDSLEEKTKSSTKKWNKPSSIEMKSNKAEKQYETKDTKKFSKVGDVKRTSKSSSTFKSENVQIKTRDDFFLFNEETKSPTSSNSFQIAEEKLDKRNEKVSFKREAKNVDTSKEPESMKKIIPDDKSLMNFKIRMKDLPKSDVVPKNIETQRNVDKMKNEKLDELSLSEVNSNVRTNEKKDSSNDLKLKKNSINDSNDTNTKNIFHSMKPIEKKKDGILIDYGVKVASRKKQEKTKCPIKDLTKNEIANKNDSIVTTITEKENQCSSNRDEIKTIPSNQPIPINIQNSMKNDPTKVEIKTLKKVTNESESLNCDYAKETDLSEIKKDDNDLKSANSIKIKKESLNEKLSKTLDKLKENLSYQNVNEFQEKFNSTNNSTTNNTMDEQYPSTKEESIKNKNVKIAKSSDEEFRVPYEGTVVQNPSKSPSKGHPNSVMEPLAGTVVRRPSKGSEKKKPKNTSYKYSSKNIREGIDKTEKQKESTYSVNLLTVDTNKSKSDFSGSKNNSGKASSPIKSNNSNNSNNSNSLKKTKSYSTTSIDLIKSNKSNKPDYKEKDKQNNGNTRDEFVNKLKRPEKDLEVSLERKEKPSMTHRRPVGRPSKVPRSCNRCIAIPVIMPIRGWYQF
ncbi:hypothetical protein M0802_004536 [Mischocyttarus mexicanus]|nr:hypothetical protein M0802_004536 [Mischocyttarus mexicanus]